MTDDPPVGGEGGAWWARPTTPGRHAPGVDRPSPSAHPGERDPANGSWWDHDDAVPMRPDVAPEPHVAASPAVLPVERPRRGPLDATGPSLPTAGAVPAAPVVADPPASPPAARPVPASHSVAPSGSAAPEATAPAARREPTGQRAVRAARTVRRSLDALCCAVAGSALAVSGIAGGDGGLGVIGVCLALYALWIFSGRGYVFPVLLYVVALVVVAMAVSGDLGTLTGP